MIDNEDEIYVIYHNGIKLKHGSYRAEYNKLGQAKSTVTKLSKSDASNKHFKNSSYDIYFSDIPKKEQSELISIEKSSYEIRVFIDSGTIIDI